MTTPTERELINLARNEEAAEKSEHPLNRIASIEQVDAGIVIKTTDIHLPRRIGEANVLCSRRMAGTRVTR